MVNLQAIIDRIDALLAEGSEASITYAALEARLALEKVCYDRLRQGHNYISHDQLKRWQPRDIMLTLMEHVDKNAALTMKLSISTTPASDEVRPEDQEYVEVGTQIGFDPKKLGKMWQALSGLALHVRLPTTIEDHIPAYGDVQKIRAKVEVVRSELVRLTNGTMISSGYGDEVIFECECGETNRRRAELLKNGDPVFCINPDCMESYTVRYAGDEIQFWRDPAEFSCENCSAPVFFPKRQFLKIPLDAGKIVPCISCGHPNQLGWLLAHIKTKKVEGSA